MWKQSLIGNLLLKQINDPCMQYTANFLNIIRLSPFHGKITGEGLVYIRRVHLVRVLATGVTVQIPPAAFGAGAAGRLSGHCFKIIGM